MEVAQVRTQLQKVRKKAGFKSAKAFAEHMGLNPNTYTDYEQGRIDFTLEKAWEFADALNCTLDELAGRESPPARIDDPLKRQVVDAYDSMTQAGRESLAGVAKGLATLPENRPGDGRPSLQAQGVA